MLREAPPFHGVRWHEARLIASLDAPATSVLGPIPPGRDDGLRIALPRARQDRPVTGQGSPQAAVEGRRRGTDKALAENAR
jgi:hypothetical protein